jgi:hypothetical protein
MQFLCQCVGKIRCKQAPLQRAYFALSCAFIRWSRMANRLKMQKLKRTLLVQYLNYAPK